MSYHPRLLSIVPIGVVLVALVFASGQPGGLQSASDGHTVTVHSAATRDVSPPLTATAPGQVTSASVEQTQQGTKAAPEIVASFDGLGDGFKGPQGTATFRNPSDNSLAVGPDHIVQLVNTKMAVFTKKGEKFDTTGKVLYGPVNTGNVFKGSLATSATSTTATPSCATTSSPTAGLIVMPMFRRLPFKKNEPTRQIGRARCN